MPAATSACCCHARSTSGCGRIRCCSRSFPGTSRRRWRTRSSAGAATRSCGSDRACPRRSRGAPIPAGDPVLPSAPAAQRSTSRFRPVTDRSGRSSRRGGAPADAEFAARPPTMAAAAIRADPGGAMSSATFDPGAYKRTTTDQWQAAAEPRHRHGPTPEAWLGPATEVMLDLAGVGPGARVLDVAAGAGGQTIAAARRAGPDGRVLATDISSNILAFAERSAREAGLANVETRVVDGERLDVPAGTFDAVISRVGFIYFPDQHAAFVSMRLALRPGGRLAGIVYSTPEANSFFSIPVSIIRRRAQLPAPAQGQPGPFSLGAPGVIEAALEKAGFSDVEVRRFPAPLRLPSTAEFVRFARESFGALHQMLAELSEAEREEAWSEIERELSRYETPDGFQGPCELIAAAATAPT